MKTLLSAFALALVLNSTALAKEEVPLFMEPGMSYSVWFVSYQTPIDVTVIKHLNDDWYYVKCTTGATPYYEWINLANATGVLPKK